MTAPEAFTLSHVYDAPRALVWQVHTEPAHLGRWLSPAGFRTIHGEMNFTAGGSYHYGLEGPGGLQMWGRQRFLEIEPEAGFSHIQTFSDASGGITRHPMDANWPREMLATTRFEDAGPGRTKVTIRWAPHESDAAGHASFDRARTAMAQGFAGTFAQLERYLAELQA